MLPIMARENFSHAWLHNENSQGKETQQPRGLAGKNGPNSAGRSVLKQFLPRRAVTQEEVLAQMEKRHKKRLASMRAHDAKQGIELLE